MVVQFADVELELNYRMENQEEVFVDLRAEVVAVHLILLIGKLFWIKSNETKTYNKMFSNISDAMNAVIEVTMQGTVGSKEEAGVGK